MRVLEGDVRESDGRRGVEQRREERARERGSMRRAFQAAERRCRGERRCRRRDARGRGEAAAHDRAVRDRGHEPLREREPGRLVLELPRAERHADRGEEAEAKGAHEGRARGAGRVVRVGGVGEHVRDHLDRDNGHVSSVTPRSHRQRRVPVVRAHRAGGAHRGRRRRDGVLREVRAQTPVARLVVDHAAVVARGLEPPHLAPARVAPPPARGRVRGERHLRREQRRPRVRALRVRLRDPRRLRRIVLRRRPRHHAFRHRVHVRPRRHGPQAVPHGPAGEE
mmetsp:Transcript_854/g.2778  ORF Transcript_854/g.2778 Transcript_854/m.2778 type:complete len:281 (-) Transcript_854:477-1319(-)